VPILRLARERHAEYAILEDCTLQKHPDGRFQINPQAFSDSGSLSFQLIIGTNLYNRCSHMITSALQMSIPRGGMLCWQTAYRLVV